MTNMGGGVGKKGNISTRGRPYVLMILVALIGIALLGVLVIHKLREKHIFTLIVQEKDRELVSLQLLIQKEKEYGKEIKRKKNEMKAKVYYLITQKTELDRRISEMQSTIDSLKDEQKVTESALEEKINEIQMLKATESERESQILNLTESLKQNEAEIANLKQQLEDSVKLHSANKDDPSDTSIEANVTQNKENGDVTDLGIIKEEGSQFDEKSTTANESENATIIEEGTNAVILESEHTLGTFNMREASTQHLQSMENLLDSKNGSYSGYGTIQNGNKTETENFEDRGAFSSMEENGVTNGNETIANPDRKQTKPTAEGSEANSITKEEDEVAKDRQVGEEHSQQEQIQDHPEKFKGDVKLEKTENYKSGGSSGKEKRARSGKSREKRWRIIARNRQLEKSQNLEVNGVGSNRAPESSRNNQDGLANGEETKAAYDDPKTSQEGVAEENNMYQEIKTVNASDVKLVDPRVHDSEDQGNEQVRDDADSDASSNVDEK